MQTRIAVLSLLAVSALPAQTPPCASANDANNNISTATTAYAFAGENNFAYQFTPTTQLVAQAMTIITNRPIATAPGFMSLEVWTDNVGLPGNRIARGSWKTDFALPAPVWQGANFDQPVVMQMGMPYWLVWVEPYGSNPATEPGGAVTLPAAYRIGTGAWSSRTAAAFKFRLYCNLLDDLNVAVQGSGCANSLGTLGTLFTTRLPQVGNSGFLVDGSGFPSASLGLLVLGVVRSFPSFPVPGLPPGCQQNIDVFTTLVAGTTGTGNVRATSVAGHLAYPMPVPQNPGLVGLYVGTQLVVFDAANTAPIPLVTSNGLQLTLY